MKDSCFSYTYFLYKGYLCHGNDSISEPRRSQCQDFVPALFGLASRGKWSLDTIFCKNHFVFLFLLAGGSYFLLSQNDKLLATVVVVIIYMIPNDENKNTCLLSCKQTRRLFFLGTCEEEPVIIRGVKKGTEKSNHAMEGQRI